MSDEKKVVLKKKKPSLIKRFNDMLNNKKKRLLATFILTIPFLIAILVFGFITYKEAKNLLSLAKNDSTTEINSKHVISSMNYVLRENANEIQEEYFAELKSAVESGETDNAKIAGLVCKNFVTDFFTWTNKAGQYDVGGMYYVYGGEQEETGKYKNLLYTQIRDSFYKYLNKYIETYGKEDLLEVESCTVTSSIKSDVPYGINEKTGIGGNDVEGWYKIFEGRAFETYIVKCSWTYKQTNVFDTSKYPTQMSFAVIYRDGKFEIVEATGGTINVDEF